MSGKTFGILQEKLREILRYEFLVQEDQLVGFGIERLEEALEAYESVADFLEKTGWDKDNPECSSEEYLIENRICRWAEGRLWYFSRIVWEDMKKY